MAPWPEQGNEPKAPDKNSSDKCENNRGEEEVKQKVEAVESSSCVPQSKSDQNQWTGCDSLNTEVSPLPVVNLDEGALRTLLEEAITYKSPKDRATKSDLFKELLQEAEADESDCSDEASGVATTGAGPGGGSRSHLSSSSRLVGTRRRHGKRDVGIAERQRSGGSLQNLVHALRGATGRPTRDHVSGSVSARQREGGSLPTNVNVQGMDSSDVDVIQCSELVCNYTTRATLQVADDPRVDMAVSFPMTSKSASSVVNGIEQTPLQLHSSYNSVKSITGSNMEPIVKTSGNSSAENSSVQFPAQHVSTCFLPISPQQIPSALEKGLKGGRSRQKQDTGNEKVAESEAKSAPPLGARIFLPKIHVRSVDEINNLFPQITNEMNRIALSNKEGTSDKKNKSVDENGNALGSANRVDPVTTNDRKGKRKMKMKNYRNFINAEQIEGHRWEEDIESLMKYIESPSSGNGTEQNKSTKSRQSNGPVTSVKSTRGVNKIKAKEDEGRKRRKETKIHKCNSLEEISKTKLEDLTSPSNAQEDNVRARPKKQVTLDDTQLGARSWESGNLEECAPPTTNKKSTDQVSDETPNNERGRKKKDKKTESLADVQDSEFHVVRKRQRKKKTQSTIYSRQNTNRVGNCQAFPPHDRRDGQLLYRYRRGVRPPENVHPRRKSASSVPPSDKSDSSDLDSVHSLPVSSTTQRPTVGKTSTSGGSTPQASYADIARSVISPPRAVRRSTPVSTVPSSAASSGIGDEEAPTSPEPVSSVTFIVPTPPTTKKDAMTDTNCDSLLPVEEYPPLEKKEPCDMFVEFTVKRGRANRETNISVEETVVLKTNLVQNNVKNDNSESATVLVESCSAPGKRPPVILLDESGRSSPQSNVTELTFGFEVNQQLLLSCDDAVQTSVEPNYTGTEMIQQYFSFCWDEIMRDYHANTPSRFGNGPKVQYYNGQ